MADKLVIEGKLFNDVTEMIDNPNGVPWLVNQIYVRLFEELPRAKCLDDFIVENVNFDKVYRITIEEV